MRVLIVVHGFPPASMGGTEVYAAAQARALTALGDEVRVLARESVPERPEYDVRDDVQGGTHVRFVNRTFRDVTCFADSYRSDRITARASDLLDDWRPDVAHVHHLTCLSTTIVPELRSRGIPVVLTLHDYWMLCHRGQLLDRHLHRCEDPRTCYACLPSEAGVGRAGTLAARAIHGIEQVVPDGAAKAIRQTAGLVAGAVASEKMGRAEADARAAHMDAVLGEVSQIVAPSRHVRDRFAAAGLDPARVIVSSNGIDTARFLMRPPRRPAPLRLGFIGGLTVSKAPHLLIEAWRRLPAGAATVVMAGAFAPYHGDDSYRDTIDPLLSLPGVQAIGPVPHDEIPKLLSTLDVLVVPSIWEENNPLAILEAFAAGVPVVASRIGGIPEIVSHGANGLLFEPGNADDLARALSRFVTEPGLRERLRAGIPRVRTLEDATRETREIYDRLVRPSTSPGRPASHTASSVRPEPVEGRTAVSAIVLNYGTPEDTLLAVRSLMASREPLSQIIVVDNSHDRQCEEALAALREEVILIRSGSNLGFSGGMNLGIRRALDAGASHVFLVNSDAIVPPATIGRLLAVLKAGPTRGVVSPVIASRSRPGVIASLGMSYSDATGRMRHRGAGERLDLAAGDDWESMPAVSGCAMLAAREVFERIGLLDEAYFFSFEDLAFCLAARDAGFDVGVARRAAVLHEGSLTLGTASPRRLYFAARNHLRAAANRPASTAVAGLARGAAIVGYNLAHAVKAPGGTLAGRVGAVLRGTRDHLRRRYGPDTPA